MAVFVRCRGRNYCVEDPEGCRTCGRSRHELDTTRALIARVAQFILEQDYDNAGEFAAYLAEKIETRVRHARDTDKRTPD